MTFTAFILYTSVLSVFAGLLCSYFYKQGKVDGRDEIASELISGANPVEMRDPDLKKFDKKLGKIAKAAPSKGAKHRGR